MQRKARTLKQDFHKLVTNVQYTFIHLAIVKITVKTQDAIGAGLTTSADVLNVKVFKIENEAFRHVT